MAEWVEAVWRMTGVVPSLLISLGIPTWAVVIVAALLIGAAWAAGRSHLRGEGQRRP